LEPVLVPAKTFVFFSKVVSGIKCSSKICEKILDLGMVFLNWYKYQKKNFEYLLELTDTRGEKSGFLNFKPVLKG
jgi:hypothetical protein